MRSLTLIPIVLTAAVIGTTASAQSYDYNATAALQRQADEMAAIRMQQRQEYYEMKERQDRQDYNDQMRRVYPNWDR